MSDISFVANSWYIARGGPAAARALRSSTTTLSTTGLVRAPLSPSSHFRQLVEEAAALPSAARAQRRADLSLGIAALDAANAAAAVAAATAAAEEEEEEDEGEDGEGGEVEVWMFFVAVVVLVLICISS